MLQAIFARPGLVEGDEVVGVDRLPDRLAAPEAADDAERELLRRVVGQLDPLAVLGHVAEPQRPVGHRLGRRAAQQRVDQALGGAAGGEQHADRRVALRDLGHVDARHRAVDRLGIAVDDVVLDDRGVELRQQPVEHQRHGGGDVVAVVMATPILGSGVLRTYALRAPPSSAAGRRISAGSHALRRGGRRG